MRKLVKLIVIIILCKMYVSINGLSIYKISKNKLFSRLSSTSNKNKFKSLLLSTIPDSSINSKKFNDTTNVIDNHYIINNFHLINNTDVQNDTMIKKNHEIIKQYQYPLNGFDLEQILESNDYNKEIKTQLKHEMKRNPMNNINVTLPVALMLLNPVEYTTLSRARREIRKGSILLSFKTNIKRGKANDRIHPLNIISKQMYKSKTTYNGMLYENPNLPLKINYQDDHIAILTKPAGIPMLSNRKVGHGRHTISAALPFILKPPLFDTELKYPQYCHRLDKPTSGLLVVAKTKPALVSMCNLFKSHQVDKTYTAIINGEPNENVKPLSSQEAKLLNIKDNNEWNIIDEKIDNKSCITLWRTLQTSHSSKARNETVTKVEIRLKTGRYHQIRRHMSWVLHCPIIGDDRYEEDERFQFTGYGLLLCANRIIFRHPMVEYCYDSGIELDVDIDIPLPDKFDTVMKKGR